MRKVLVMLSLSAIVFASCAKSDNEAEGQKPQPGNLTVKAVDYSFPTAPKTAESGEVSINFTNGGKEPHQAQLFKMNEGTQVGQLVEEAKKPDPDRNLLKFGTFAGGPNAVDPGESQVAVAQLEAGRYAFFCQVPDAKGRAHLSLGMVSELTVTQADEEAEAPSADYSASAKEFSFELPEKWQGTIAFENRGKQPHEFQVMEIAKGKTAQDFENWFKADPAEAGPPTWTTGGGVANIQPGETASFDADLKPGTYYMMCFVTDPSTKKFHYALGMMQKFEVK